MILKEKITIKHRKKRETTPEEGEKINYIEVFGYEKLSIAKQSDMYF